MPTRSRTANSPRRNACVIGLAVSAVSLIAGCGGAPPDQNAQPGTAFVQDGVTYAVQTSR
jgi:hypothetical protein